MLASAGAQADDKSLVVAKGGALSEPSLEKVVVFDLGALDILDRLNVPVGGVMAGPKPDYLSRYASRDVETFGTIFKPDYEALNATPPSLILLGNLSLPNLEPLSSLAPAMALKCDNRNFFASVRDNTRLLAGLAGKKDAGETELSSIEATIEAVRSKATQQGTGLIVLITGSRLSVFGPGSRYGAIHDTFGIKPSAADIVPSEHGQPVGYEFILNANPDWLFVLNRDTALGRDGNAARQALDNDLVRSTKAWKNGRVVYLDPAAWYLVGCGLTASHRMADQLLDAFTSH